MRLENTENFADMVCEWKCLVSKVRADILMLVFDIEEQIAWEEALEKAHSKIKHWNELTDEEKREWIEF